MKIKHLLQATVLMLLVSTTSCKKSSTNNNNNPNNNDTTVTAGKAIIKFNYTGAESGTFSSAASASTCVKGVFIQLNGIRTTTGSLVVPQATFYIDPSITVGEHRQGDPVFSNGTTFTFSNGNFAAFNAWASDAGTATGFILTITKNDATGIEGTFSGELGSDENTTKVTISNGTFRGLF